MALGLTEGFDTLNDIVTDGKNGNHSSIDFFSLDTVAAFVSPPYCYPIVSANIRFTLVVISPSGPLVFLDNYAVGAVLLLSTGWFIMEIVGWAIVVGEVASLRFVEVAIDFRFSPSSMMSAVSTAL